MDWKTISADVAKFAPVIGGLLGGPGGAAIGGILSKALGCANEPDAVMAALPNATPEQIVAAQKEAHDFAVKMREQQVAADKVSADDRRSARELMVATRNRTPEILSFVYTVGYFGLLVLLMSGAVKLPDGEEKIFEALISMLGAAQLAVVNYWFGSSHGSQTKTEIGLLE